MFHALVGVGIETRGLAVALGLVCVLVACDDAEEEPQQTVEVPAVEEPQGDPAPPLPPGDPLEHLAAAIGAFLSTGPEAFDVAHELGVERCSPEARCGDGEHEWSDDCTGVLQCRDDLRALARRLSDAEAVPPAARALLAADPGSDRQRVLRAAYETGGVARSLASLWALSSSSPIHPRCARVPSAPPADPSATAARLREEGCPLPCFERDDPECARHFIEPPDARLRAELAGDLRFAGWLGQKESQREMFEHLRTASDSVAGVAMARFEARLRSAVVRDPFRRPPPPVHRSWAGYPRRAVRGEPRPVPRCAAGIVAIDRGGIRIGPLPWLAMTLDGVRHGGEWERASAAWRLPEAPEHTSDALQSALEDLGGRPPQPEVQSFSEVAGAQDRSGGRVCVVADRSAEGATLARVLDATRASLLESTVWVGATASGERTALWESRGTMDPLGEPITVTRRAVVVDGRRRLPSALDPETHCKIVRVPHGFTGTQGLPPRRRTIALSVASAARAEDLGAVLRALPCVAFFR